MMPRALLALFTIIAAVGALLFLEIDVVEMMSTSPRFGEDKHVTNATQKLDERMLALSRRVDLLMSVVLLAVPKARKEVVDLAKRHGQLPLPGQLLLPAVAPISSLASNPAKERKMVAVLKRPLWITDTPTTLPLPTGICGTNFNGAPPGIINP